MSLLYRREFLKFYSKSIQFERFTDTRTKTIFHRRNTSWNTGVAVQDNAAQQWWSSTILAVNTISNTGKYTKTVHPDFFGEDGGRSSHHSNLQNQWLQVVDYDEDTGNQRGKPSTLTYSFPYTQHTIITSWAQTRIITGQFDSLTDIPIDWLILETIDSW